MSEPAPFDQTMIGYSSEITCVFFSKPKTQHDLNVISVGYFSRKLAKHIKHFLLARRNETEFFDIDAWRIKVELTNFETLKIAVKRVVTGLETHGWKCALSYGDTGLFIYSTEKPPPTYHGDGL